MHLDACDRLGVAAVEVFGQAEHRGKRADDLPAFALEVAEAFVATAGRRAAVITGDERDGLDFVRLEAAQIAVAD